MINVEIQNTTDGSPTLYRSDIDEHYHSVKGAATESRHIYINRCWREAAERAQPVRVFEAGFGTGLNAAMTARAARDSSIVTYYCSIELYPLQQDVVEALTPLIDESVREEFIAVNSAEWDKEVAINPYFTLKKIQGDLLTAELPRDISAVYFDAFAPEKQPEMWGAELFRKIYDVLIPGGILATYCAKGAIRRLLQQTGFQTSRLPGPPGGKREILQATKPRIIDLKHNFN